MSGIHISQAAPTVPTKNVPLHPTYGVSAPVSAPTQPSVYNKKLSKLFRGRLVVLDSNETVGNALRTLAHFNVSGAPVLRRADNIVLGFIDMLDMLSFLFVCCGIEVPKSGEPLRNLPIDFGTKYDDFMNAKIDQIVGLSGRDKLEIVHGDLAMSEAVDNYFKKGVHRLGICDDNGDIIGVVSQWTIINYLATVPTEDKQWIPALQTPLCDYPFRTEKIQAVDRNASTLDAFLQMHVNGLSAVAVTDQDGKLCGNLSASDLKGWHLFQKDLRDLNIKVGDFLGVVRKFQGRNSDFVVALRKNALINEAIFKMNREFVHRLYIIDENYIALGVLSLTDIMKGIVVDTHEAPTYARPVTAVGEVRTKPLSEQPEIATPSPRPSV